MTVVRGVKSNGRTQGHTTAARPWPDEKVARWGVQKGILNVDGSQWQWQSQWTQQPLKRQQQQQQKPNDLLRQRSREDHQEMIQGNIPLFINLWTEPCYLRKLFVYNHKLNAKCISQVSPSLFLFFRLQLTVDIVREVNFRTLNSGLWRWWRWRWWW